MEIKINREIRDYTESVFFGLSLRQAVFSAAAVGVAVAVFFLLRPVLSMETVSWLCILAAAPFAALGFIRYHGMNAEKLLWSVIRDRLLEPRRLTVHHNNFYHELMKGAANEHKKDRRNGALPDSEDGERPDSGEVPVA